MNDVAGHVNERWKTATDSEASTAQRLLAGGELIGEGLLAAGAAYGLSRLGVTINAGAQIGARTIIGHGAFIDKDVKLGEEVIVGDGAHIGAGTNFWGRSRIAPGVKMGKDITVPSGTNIDLRDRQFPDGSHLL
jgi:NDP-sugar pyrophosphorylase family protein